MKYIKLFQFNKLSKLNIIKRYFSIYYINIINNFTKNNIKYLTTFEIKIRNPDKLDIFNSTIYEGRLSFNKNNMYISKIFENNE